MDSGAYSVWAAQRQGRAIHPLDVREYVSFIHLHADVIDSVVNLDVIGDPSASERNAWYLKEHGINQIPVWHVQSPWDLLDAMVESDEPVIAIGGSAFLSTCKRRQIFDELFRRYPSGVAFHLLGGTSPFIGEYAWFSTDSTAYLNGRRFRALVTPALQMQAPADWNTEECLAFSIKAFAGMEANYARQYQLPILLKPGISK